MLQSVESLLVRQFHDWDLWVPIQASTASLLSRQPIAINFQPKVWSHVHCIFGNSSIQLFSQSSVKRKRVRPIIEFRLNTGLLVLLVILGMRFEQINVFNSNRIQTIQSKDYLKFYTLLDHQTMFYLHSNQSPTSFRVISTWQVEGEVLNRLEIHRLTHPKADTYQALLIQKEQWESDTEECQQTHPNINSVLGIIHVLEFMNLNAIFHQINIQRLFDSLETASVLKLSFDEGGVWTLKIFYKLKIK